MGKFRVTGHAKDAEALMRGLRAGVPDILLLDLNMPGVKGVETVAGLHREFATPQS